MKLSESMRGALEAVARGGAYQNRISYQRYSVTFDADGKEQQYYSEATFNALRKRELIEYGDTSPGYIIRMPWKITEAGRAELERKP